MTINVGSTVDAGQNTSYHGDFNNADATLFNLEVSSPIGKAGSEKNNGATSGFENLFSTAETQLAAPAEAKGADQTQAESVPECNWSVDQENKTIHLDNGYKIVIEGKDQAWQIFDDEGNMTRIWGDPHVHEGDGGKWDFKADMTFELEDGTKITVQTKEWGNGMTVSDNLIITKGDSCVQVTGLAANRPIITEVTSNGQAMDVDTYDGYVATEMGAADDWSLDGEEIVSNLPFVDHKTYLQGLDFFYGKAYTVDLFDPTKVYTEEEIKQRYDILSAELNNKLAETKAAQENSDGYHDKIFYKNSETVLEVEIQALNHYRNTGTLEERIEIFNSVHTKAAPQTGANQNILDVADIIQGKNECGPNALRMVFDYYGKSGSFDLHEYYWRGTSVRDVEKYAEDHGMKVGIVNNSNIDQLKHYLDHDMPVIVLGETIDGEDGEDHYIVVRGYSVNPADGSTTFYVNDGDADKGANNNNFPNKGEEWTPEELEVFWEDNWILGGERTFMVMAPEHSDKANLVPKNDLGDETTFVNFMETMDDVYYSTSETIYPFVAGEFVGWEQWATNVFEGHAEFQGAAHTGPVQVGTYALHEIGECIGGSAGATLQQWANDLSDFGRDAQNFIEDLHTDPLETLGDVFGF